VKRKIAALILATAGLAIPAATAVSVVGANGVTAVASAPQTHYFG
jgi:hypothetical protein